MVELPDPTPGPGEVLARVLAVSVNHLDLWVRRGMPGMPLPLPMIPGCDGTGEVVEVGEGVTQFAVGDRVVLVEGCSDTLRAVLRAAGVGQVQGVLLDLGVSSMQLDDPVRGFSFRHDGPLSMRMGKGPGVKSAMKLLQDSTVSELERILREYGEEPSARRIASRLKNLCRRRPPRTTLELANFIESLHPHRPRGRSAAHPATRVFQALRIAVNDEMGVLERTLPLASEALAPGGRLAVISFQSLDDRIVKRFMRDGHKDGTFAEITKKPIRPEEDELERNPRSRSARLRVAVRRKDDATA
ncbi:MAG: 16S rRNA (cytosine(1402)-N(4))-methyltransferase RsmH [Planctomycetes bacterium]|nr:16S rRNA (cytosine(1402)-N(4))-methyltransferase RsmH [Planctomycetota bacterium]